MVAGWLLLGWDLILGGLRRTGGLLVGCCLAGCSLVGFRGGWFLVGCRGGWLDLVGFGWFLVGYWSAGIFGGQGRIFEAWSRPLGFRRGLNTNWLINSLIIGPIERPKQVGFESILLCLRVFVGQFVFQSMIT